MSVTFQWDNPEHTTIYCAFIDPWTWEEFDHMVHETNNLFDEAGHIVDMIFDCSESHHMPSDAINHFRRFPDKKHPYLGTIVVTNLSRVMHLIGDIIIRLYPESGSHIRMGVDPDEARNLLAKIKAGRAKKA